MTDLSQAIAAIRGERAVLAARAAELQGQVNGINIALKILDQYLAETATPALKTPPVPEQRRDLYHSSDRREAVRLLSEQGKTVDQIVAETGLSRGSVSQNLRHLRGDGPKKKNAKNAVKPKSPAKPKRRFKTQFKAWPREVGGLPANHLAVIEKTTLFPSTVVDVKDSPRLLVSGQNSRKLGDRVVKGPWAGMPIFSLTLEERATCPESCHHWRTCYGNGMPRARRHRHGTGLEAALAKEIESLAKEFPDGFVVRLHQLGDFYSNTYACLWWTWLSDVPSLHVFGYTAHRPKSKIGRAIGVLNREFKDRCTIRFSCATPQPMGATTIWREARGQIEEGTVCPAQTGDTDCCGSCGLCWHPNFRDRCIVFMAHGPKFNGRQSNEEINPKLQALARNPWPAEMREAVEPVQT